MWKFIDFQAILTDKKPLLSQFLLGILICTVLIWYIQFLWKRRKIYRASYVIFGQIMRIFNHYPGIFGVWFGSRLFYAVSDPKYFEILLTGTHALRKDSLYSFTHPVIGQGLFSAISVMKIVMIRGYNIFYHSDVIFKNSPLGKDFHYVTDKLRSFTKQVLIEKKKRNTKRKETPLIYGGTPKRSAFLDLLLEINNEGKFHFTDEELMDETITFIIAGSDTTAASNCFTLTMLGLHQDIQEKVLAETLEVVGSEGSVDLTHLPQLKYLERVIKESLRLFPLGSIAIRTADEDIDLGDCVVLKGCSIVFGVLRAHRNEEYWPNPYKFDPDRFLPEEVAKRRLGAYIPFLYGPRNYIGMEYAMMAMKTLVVTVVRNFQVLTSYKSVEEIQLKTNMVLRPKDGYKVALKLRNPL